MSDLLLLHCRSPPTGRPAPYIHAAAAGEDGGVEGGIGSPAGGAQAEALADALSVTKVLELKECLRVATIDNFQVGVCSAAALSPPVL
jgi:hypothetical protein